MANTRQSNTWYVDTATSALTTDINQKIAAIIISNTAANAVLTLRETSGGSNKITLKNATDGSSQLFDFALKPIVFGTGIYVQTCTNCVATLILTNKGAE